MAKIVDDAVVELYAFVDGQKVEIENLSYTISRETEPVFQMGTPMPMYTIGGRRELVGSFSVDKAGYNELRKRRTMDVLINDYKSNRTITLRGLEIMNLMCNGEEEQYLASFIAHDLNAKELKKLEDMNKRELAKQLLEKEY